MSNKTTRRLPRSGPTPVGERLRATTIPARSAYDIPWTTEEWVAWEEDDTCRGCDHIKDWCRCDDDA
jgi:hypothetical protein